MTWRVKGCGKESEGVGHGNEGWGMESGGVGHGE